MAKSKLEYWTGSAWTEAKTIENQNALIRLELNDSLNNSMKANITLGNGAHEPFKEGDAAHADRYGPLTSVFTDFMPIRIIETDTNVVLFHGRVYDIKNIYDKARGNVVKLYARDHLSELADYPTDDKDAEIEVGAGTDPSILNRSQLIKHIIRDSSTDPQRSSLQISVDNIAFDDALKFPASGREFSTDHKDSYKVNSLGRQGLKAIYEIAKGDPHEVTGDITEYGYDFYGDSQFTLASVTNPALDFNYFKRGTRPIFESTPSAFKGLRVEFPIATEFSETGSSVLMLPDYDFNLPKRDLYTGATAAIKRDTVINANTADTEETISRNFNLEFELLEVSSISAAFTWKNKLLVKWNSTAAASEIAEELQDPSGNKVGRIQYQSVTSGSGDPSNGKPAYILISFEPDSLDDSDIITQKKNFNALTGSSAITLTGVSSSRTLSYTPSTGRIATTFGLTRPLRISASDSKHVDSMRRRIASALSRSKTSRTDCTVRTIPPPFIYVDTTVSSETGSPAVPTLAIDAQAHGFRTGMTIAKIDSTGEQTAYGYATAVSSGAITAPLNTGDWDGYTGSEARVRLYFPVRAGHYLYAKNLLANFTGYMFIKSSVYTEEPGMQATMYKGSGVNTAGSAIGLGIDPNSIQASIEGEGNKYPKDVNVPIGGLGYTFEKIDTTRTAKFTSVDQNTISWTGGRMVIGGGGLSYEVVAGSVDLSTSNDNKTNLPVVYKVVFIDPDEQTPDSSGRYAFSFILSSTSKSDHDHIVMAHARASKNSSGKAAIIFDGSGLGLYGGIDAAGEDQFTAALFKRSLQPYTTDVAINVGTSGGATKNRHVNSTAGTISFADNNTVSVDVNTSLDLWNYPIGNIGVHADNNNKTWYIFLKLVKSDNSETDDFTLVANAEVDRTLVYGDATSDSRGLLAICGTGDTTQTGGNLEEIAIQAFHGKGQNITADTIAANAIVAGSIKAGTIDTTKLAFTAAGTGNIVGMINSSSEGLDVSGAKIEITGSTTFASNYDPSVALTAANAAASDAASAQSTANTANSTANSKTTIFRASTAPTALKVGDMWVDTDDHKVYTASATGSSNWVLRDDAGAISNATTNISGGRIATQAIILKSGGAGNSNNADSVLNTDAVSSNGAGASRVVLSNTGIFGFDSNSATQFYMQASDGKGYFGGGQITLDAVGLTVGTSGVIKSTGKDSADDSTGGFFLGHDGGSSYDFGIGNDTQYILWNGDAGTLTIGGGVTISGTTLTDIRSKANSATQVGDHAGIQSAAVTTALAGDHTGNLNGLDINNTTGSRIQFSNSGIIGYTTGSTKSFELSADPVATPFRVFGTYTGESSGNDQTATDPNRGVEFLSTISGTTYVAAISATDTASELRYDASTHSFMNFHQGGWLDDIYALTLRPSGIAGQNIVSIIGYPTASYDMHIEVKSAGADLRLWSQYGNVELKAGDGASGDDRILFKASADNGHTTYVSIVGDADTRPEGMHQDWGNFYAKNIFPLGYTGSTNTGGHNTYSIGAETSRFYRGWFDQLEAVSYITGDMILNNLNLKDNSFDGTRGHWLIQEGSDDLFIENKVTGKKYKFKLEEV